MSQTSVAVAAGVRIVGCWDWRGRLQGWRSNGSVGVGDLIQRNVFCEVRL